MKREISSWPWEDDRIVVEAMRNDSQSNHWEECLEFVNWRLTQQARNIAQDDWDDLGQNIMIKIYSSIGKFEFRSKFTTWTITIISHAIADFYRKEQKIKRFQVLTIDSFNMSDAEEGSFAHTSPLAIDEQVILDDKLTKAFGELANYIASHSNQGRNAQIIDMVLLQGKTLEEVAQELHCSSPVVESVK
jgi:RNA polymerase sigma factor (sigma-70 family)